MSLLGMPMVVINLGCEMVYILEQRLKAQGISSDKSANVLQDIVRTMFYRSFMCDKLFVPQEMYSLISTRKIFDRLAHSSIMRLSESSMDKLFDLMVMAAKYQLLCSTRLDDMVQATLRHLGTTQAILMTAMAAGSATGAVDSSIIGLISQAENTTVRFYGMLSMGELALLRCTLARFFQDKHVKVSLFLSEGIQLSSGKLVIPSCINDQVGIVRTYDADGKLEGEERLQAASQKADMNEFFCHPVPLGDNLYRKDRDEVVPPVRAAEGAKPKQPESLAGQPSSLPARYAEEQPATDSKAAAKELDLLVALMKVNKTSTDKFKLNLFDGAAHDDLYNTEPALGNTQGQELWFGSLGRNEEYVKAVGLSDELGDTCTNDKKDAKTMGEDLLDLMDSIA